MAIEGKRILYVHNTTRPEQELEEVFRDLNYDVVSSNSLKEASELLHSEKIHLILAAAEGKAQGADLCVAARREAKTKQLPIVLMSPTSGGEDAHQNPKEKADAYIRLPSPPEEIVDWVERLIGLPPPPLNGHAAPAKKTDDKAHAEVAFLRGQVEDLQTQLQGFRQPGTEVSSPSIRRSTQDMEALLNELQEDGEKLRNEKVQLRDELQILKSELAQKDRELHKRDLTVDEAKEDAVRQNAELKRQLEELRTTYDEADQQHKKAQNALREYYKPKIGQTTKLEKKLETMEAEMKTLRETMDPLKQEIEELKEEVAKERSKSEQARALLSSASKLFSS